LTVKGSFPADEVALFSKGFKSAQGSHSVFRPKVPGSIYSTLIWPDREANYSIPFSVDVKSVWSSASTTPFAYIVCFFIKNTTTFTFIKLKK